MAFALVLIFFLSSPAYAGYQNLAIAAGQSDFYYDASKNQTFARFAANDPIYNAGTQTVNTTRPYNVVGIDGKTYQTTITRAAAVDIPKVGAALSKFAQRVGPLAMALATADLICTLSSICKNANNEFEIAGTDPYPGMPNSYPAANGQWFGWNSTYYPDIQSACGDSARLIANIGTGVVFDHAVQLNAATYECYGRRLSDNQVFPASNTTQSVGCASQYTVSGSNCLKTGALEPHSPTSSDWENAETALSTPGAAERLAIELEPMPIQVPATYSPLQLPIGRITTTNRDAIGNATGTKVSERRLEIEDAATPQEPNRAKIEEISTETTFDLNGNPVSSTETKTET